MIFLPANLFPSYAVFLTTALSVSSSPSFSYSYFSFLFFCPLFSRPLSLSLSLCPSSSGALCCPLAAGDGRVQAQVQWSIRASDGEEPPIPETAGPLRLPAAAQHGGGGERGRRGNDAPLPSWGPTRWAGMRNLEHIRPWYGPDLLQRQLIFWNTFMKQQGENRDCAAMGKHYKNVNRRWHHI